MSVMKIAVLCFAALLAAPSTLAEFSFGVCPTKTGVTVTDANLQATWNVERRYFDLLELDTLCTKITILGAASPHQTTVRSQSALTNVVKTFTGITNLASGANGIIDLSLNSGFLSGSFARRFIVVAAETVTPPATPSVYVLWSCDNLPIGSIQNAWVLTRVGSTVTDATITGLINSAGLILTRFTPLSTTCSA